MNRLRVVIGVLVVSFLAGCSPSGSGSSGTAYTPSAAPATSAPISRGADRGDMANATPHYYRESPQTNLARIHLMIGPAETSAELCTTVPEVATGLMHRKSIGPEETMFFAFGEGQPRSFYMKNVPFDISAAYIDSEGVVSEIILLKAMDETPVSSKTTNIQYVLEAAPYWFTRHGVVAGAAVRTESGSLARALSGKLHVR